MRAGGDRGGGQRGADRPGFGRHGVGRAAIIAASAAAAPAQARAEDARIARGRPRARRVVRSKGPAGPGAGGRPRCRPGRWSERPTRSPPSSAASPAIPPVAGRGVSAMSGRRGCAGRCRIPAPEAAGGSMPRRSTRRNGCVHRSPDTGAHRRPVAAARVTARGCARPRRDRARRRSGRLQPPGWRSRHILRWRCTPGGGVQGRRHRQGSRRQ